MRGSAEPEVLEVRETRHGPILDAYMIGSTPPEVVVGGITETYALRWAGLDETITPATLFDLNAASTFDQFRAALAGWHSPGQNFVYADVDGKQTTTARTTSPSSTRPPAAHPSRYRR